MAEPEIPEYVWVVFDDRILTCPIVERYVLVQQHKSSVTVMIRGFEVLLRKQSGRTFYTDEASLRAALRKKLNHKLDWHRKACQEIEKILETGVRCTEHPSTMPNKTDESIIL